MSSGYDHRSKNLKQHIIVIAVSPVHGEVQSRYVYLIWKMFAETRERERGEKRERRNRESQTEMVCEHRGEANVRLS